jgi:hypothetical protein
VAERKIERFNNLLYLCERKSYVAGILLPVEKIVPLLASAPGYIEGLTDGLTEDQLHAAPAVGEWSANEVLAHLRSCADVWGQCIITILHDDKPAIRATNPRTWIQSTDYLEQKFKPSLKAYAAQRKELLSILEHLKPNAWSRSATVTGAGKPLTRSVHTYADSIAIHERPHLKQIKRIVDALQKT